MNPTLTLFLQVSAIIVIYALLAYLLYIMKSMQYLKKQQAKFKIIHQTIRIGQRVLLSSGLIGTVLAMDNETLRIELSKGLEIESSIYSVQTIL